MKGNPTHWNEVPLGNLCRPRQWPTISSSQLTASGIPAYGANGRIGHFSEANHSNDVVAITCRGATCGNLNYICGPSYVTGNAMCLDDVKTDQVSLRYLFRVLDVADLSIMVTGGAQPQIIKSAVEEYTVLLPPRSEQDSIENLLESWDHAIAKTEALVAAKRQAMRALTQRLTCEGVPRRLTDVVAILFSGVDKKIASGERSVRLCNYMDVYANTRIVAGMRFMEGTATDSEIRRFELRAGDVLFTKDSETADDIAASAHVPADLPGVVCGYHLAIARPDQEQVHGGYLAFAMRSPAVLTQFSRAANGVVRFGLTLDTMDKIKLRVPTLERQRAVANTLAAADEEIDLLTAQADALRRQKRGLMQKLLTGEWRVGDAEARAAAE